MLKCESEKKERVMGCMLLVRRPWRRCDGWSTAAGYSQLWGKWAACFNSGILGKDVTWEMACGKCVYPGHRMRTANACVLSVSQFSLSVVSDSLRPHESQHARPPCPSPTLGVHSDSRPSSQWCHQPSHPLSAPSPCAPSPSKHQSIFQWVNSSHEVAKVLEFQL